MGPISLLGRGEVSFGVTKISVILKKYKMTSAGPSMKNGVTLFYSKDLSTNVSCHYLMYISHNNDLCYVVIMTYAISLL